MRVVSLGSGSSGNALLVEAGPRRRTRLLVDAGLSARTIISRLLTVGVAPEQLQAILVTHEHSDHVQAIPTLARRYGVAVATEPRTYAALEEGLTTGVWRSDAGRLVSTYTEYNADDAGDQVGVVSVSASVLEAGVTGQEREREQTEHAVATASFTRIARPPRTIPFPLGSRLAIGDIDVQSFPTSHDAAAPAGYLLSAGGCRICIVTDSGEVTDEMLAHMKQADLLILEANHDRQRLLRGPYPHMLKQRILSPTGHLSNDQAANAVLRTWRPQGIRWLWLAHLSRTNNTPAIALHTMRTHLQESGVNPAYIHISALPPTLGHIWDSTQLWHAPSLWVMER